MAPCTVVIGSLPKGTYPPGKPVVLRLETIAAIWLMASVQRRGLNRRGEVARSAGK